MDSEATKSFQKLEKFFHCQYCQNNHPNLLLIIQQQSDEIQELKQFANHQHPDVLSLEDSFFQNRK
ncbi:VHS/ENTH/ANTH domain-containing protein [Candidatus Venteria ishoeyi]|uniref:Uncharacterized protein n=1 Tax=Candidatus Venteria ishoeyi TaxID=1899563 RepID=A0A1H6F820_9GAMM|nr:hypothetical protein [Candidatus Venteria ishoeyi]SEH05469.1 Uncharacterised protein [Candidatus Venteria ishoeyi]